ncbi:hypothetical protein K441DRAFT_612850 [Neofusicoccum parvum]|nr:hypothetical protein K441DRAFT_612850 [Neofusicoccum parvum]
MSFFAAGVALLSAFLSSYLWRVFIQQLPRSRRQSKTNTVVSALAKVGTQHEAARQLKKLVETDGAGEWPPKTDYTSWPSELRPYHDIYLEMAPLLSTAQVSLEDSVNQKRRETYRATMRKLLNERVRLPRVEAILAEVEGGNWDHMTRDAYNGLFGCVALSRHAYRWATIPVVKIAQEEKFVDLPVELDVPWKFLCRHFGVSSPGGNVTSNFLCNFDAEGKLIYEINHGMSKTITVSEYHFGHVFVAIERLAFPIYFEMVKAMIAFESKDRVECLKHVQNIERQMRGPLKVFYDSTVDSRISRSVWLSYVQGFQGWAAGEVVDGTYVEYDGLSGNQLLFFQIMDAFLGMDAYLPEENLLRYIPAAQRELCSSFRHYSFRANAQKSGYGDIEDVMANIVKQMRVFRATHRTRATPYLSASAPERFIMTAGKSILEGHLVQGVKGGVDSLYQMLMKRLKDTV